MLTVDYDLLGLQPGDLVTMTVPPHLPHIAIISDALSADGLRPLILHNIGRGTQGAQLELQRVHAFHERAEARIALLARPRARDVRGVTVHLRAAVREQHAPGQILVFPRSFFLYHVFDTERAIRYGVGVGKAGLAFRGSAIIERKAG